jgi:hypothetical protein
MAAPFQGPAAKVVVVVTALCGFFVFFVKTVSSFSSFLRTVEALIHSENVVTL